MNRLSGAKNVIVIGHGPGCAAVMELLARRSQYKYHLARLYAEGVLSAQNILRHAKAVCMIVGHTEVPELPSSSREMRDWYMDVRL